MSDEEDPRTAFCILLFAKRMALGLTQAEVGERIGVHGNTVGRWENGRNFPQADAAVAWAEALGVQVRGGSLREVFRGDPVCGTRAGYFRHKKRHQRCPACWAANSEYNAAWVKRRAEQVNEGGAPGAGVRDAYGR